MVLGVLGNRIGHLDPETLRIDEYPLPPPIVRAGPGIYAGAGPFELTFDEHGDLWIAEEFDGTISRLRPSVASTHDCLHLDSTNNNPCIEEIVVASGGYDRVTAHTVTVGAAGVTWFGLSDDINHTGRIGFIDTDFNNGVILLPIMADVQNVSGVVQDRLSGDVWFAEFSDRKIGRLRLALGDADGVPSATDNCIDVYNPGQENVDRNFVDLPPNRPYDDLTWPNSDDIGDACDPDADNDGLSNDVEAALPGLACPSATAPTDPLLRDTDGDNVLDGAECRLGSDPAELTSFPSQSRAGDADRDQLSDAFELIIGTDPHRSDTDGDRVSDGIEFKNYNSDPLRKNSDGDKCDDGKEVDSVNNDQWVNVLDILLVAVSNIAVSLRYDPAFDINKDGTVNSGDVGLTAFGYGPC